MLYNPRTMRKTFWIVIILLTVGLLIFSFSELQTIAETLRKANYGIILLALFVQSFWLYNMGLTFQSLYQLMELEERAGYLAKLAIATNFVNVVAPTFGFGGAALFINYGKKRGQPSGKITAITALFTLLDHGSFIVVLALGIIVLIRRNNLTTSEVGASFFMILIFSFFLSLVVLGMQSAEKLRAFLLLIAGLINRIAERLGKKTFISTEQVTRYAAEIADGLTNIKQHPKRLAKPIFFALLSKALLISIVLLMFLAFKVPFSSGTIIGGFSIGYLFQLVSVTPSGIGFMESAFALALKSLRVSWSNALIITLAYRAVTFWFSLGIGALGFRQIEKENT